MKTLKNAMLIASILFIPITMEILSFTSLITEADLENKDNVKTRQVVVVEEVDAIENKLNREVTLDKSSGVNIEKIEETKPVVSEKKERPSNVPKSKDSGSESSFIKYFIPVVNVIILIPILIIVTIASYMGISFFRYKYNEYKIEKRKSFNLNE